MPRVISGFSIPLVEMFMVGGNHFKPSDPSDLLVDLI